VHGGSRRIRREIQVIAKIIRKPTALNSPRASVSLRALRVSVVKKKPKEIKMHLVKALTHFI